MMALGIRFAWLKIRLKNKKVTKIPERKMQERCLNIKEIESIVHQL